MINKQDPIEPVENVENKEEFGNLPAYPKNVPEDDKNVIAGLTSDKLGSEILEQKMRYMKKTQILIQ